VSDHRCRVCGTVDDVVQQFVPSESGPGWTETVCTLCIGLPGDPDTITDSMTKILMRIAGVDR
jgi:hypothetical protein